MSERQEVIHSRIWEETPEPDNPFAAAACYCAGYDVYGDLLGRASWAEYLYLLFKGERPTPAQAGMLENLAVALANPGPREPSVHAAMCGGTGGSTNASSLMAALAVGAGRLGGAREVADALTCWQQCGTDPAAWRERLRNPPVEDIDVWPAAEHPPGFDPHGSSCAAPVRQTLAKLKEHSESGALAWLHDQRQSLETVAGCPLSMSGVAAAALFDLGMDSDQAEMLYLLLRLPGAAVHALEQKEYGWRRFPFFAGGLKLVDDPGPKQI